ncbi:MAG: ABC transporter permease [Planctomycetota bacterium]
MSTTPNPTDTAANADARPTGAELQAVTGVQLAQGIGHRPSEGFWTEAWRYVLRRPGAVFGLCWMGVVAFFAVCAPVFASGHPLLIRDVAADGSTPPWIGVVFSLLNPADVRVASPLINQLTTGDVILLLGTLLAIVFMLLPIGMDRRKRLQVVLIVAVQAGIAAIAKAGLVSFVTRRDASQWVRDLEQASWFEPAGAAALALVAALPFFFIHPLRKGMGRLSTVAVVGVATAVLLSWTWTTPVQRFDARERVASGESQALFTVVPWSPTQSAPSLSVMQPGRSVFAGAVNDTVAAIAEDAGRRTFTDDPRPGEADPAGVALADVPLTPSSRADARRVVGVVAGTVGSRSRAQELAASYDQLVGAGEIATAADVIAHVRTVLVDAGGSAARAEREISRFVSGIAAGESVAFRDDPRLGRASPNGIELADLPLTDRRIAIIEDQIVFAAPVLFDSPSRLQSDLRDAIDAGEVSSVGDAIDWLRDRPAPRFLLGTDALGQDVLSQILHACRLSISIGLVSTSIAVLIGVTIGALMGYFGGVVDLLLYRVVEVFMAIPVLFLLIVAAAVLPRNTYMMMAIIGCFTWTTAARFIRAEFFKLRGQDFVQSARAVGLPLRSVLFKHMLPNGVTPVLVDASFAVALAISFEVVLSFLGLGPANQPSWGRLLSDATNQIGQFVWWLAIFPGLVIFMTILSCNLIGEALRDAIDPKLKKARV